MAAPAVIPMSPYTGNTVILPTKHAKSVAIGPVFDELLGASVIEYIVDTDRLGTFSGEVARKNSALDCARQKCEWAFEKLGTAVDYAIASEGSFVPHPYVPMLPCDHEILYFIDRKRGFHLHVSTLCEETNYRSDAVDSLEALKDIAETVLFPSHGLILRTRENAQHNSVIKGITDWDALESAFREVKKCSADGKVGVETDMRAHMNPTRMSVIKSLASRLTRQLATCCSACGTPGWGRVNVEKGLPCEYCSNPTDMVAYEVHGCPLCAHTEKQPRCDNLHAAPQMHCGQCNP